MTGDLTLRSTRVVTPTGVVAADVVCRGGLIVEIVPHGSSRDAYDLGDRAMLPGATDAHVHVNEPGRTDWEGFDTATRAALLGGVTTIADMPLNAEPVTTSDAAFEAKVEATTGELAVDVVLYGGITPENADRPDEIERLARSGAAAFKCFLCPSGLDSFEPVSRSQLTSAMSTLAGLGKRLLVHAEVAADDATLDSTRIPAAWTSSRPPSWELRAIDWILDGCRETGCAVHVVHLATGDALEALADARAAGLPVTVETCPHYLTFDLAQIPIGGTAYKCAPPIRDAENREALWQGLADGVIDFVATDHSPCPPELKRLEAGDFSSAWGGIASLQLLVPAVWSEARRRGFELEDMVRWVCERPASFLGLEDRGRIVPGARADLVVFEPEADFQVVGEELAHRHATTPYAGRRLLGVVSEVIRAGRRRGAESERDGRVLRLRPGLCHKSRPKHVDWLHVDADSVRQQLVECCGSGAWVDHVLARWPYAGVEQFFLAVEESFDVLRREDWLDAFAAHPRIGDLDSLRERHASTKEMARSEQSGTASASDETLRALAEGNRRYEERFDHVFLICASGRSAQEMLVALEKRLENDASAELRIASEEQRKITTLRLQKLLGL